MLNALSADHQYKKDEIILSFPQSLFANAQIPTKELLYKNAIWTTRDFANANQSALRQAASYCSLLKQTSEGLQVAMYYRESKGDSRLLGKRSIGYGGHPEFLEDVSIDEPNNIEVVIIDSASREVAEEIKLRDVNGKSITPNLIPGDLILRTDTEIDRCHVGFWLYGFVGEDVVAKDTDPDNDRFAGWVTLDELEHLAQEGALEFWSVEVLQRLRTMESNTL